jgi:hypothetical protein
MSLRTAKATPEEWLKAIGVDEEGHRIPALVRGEDEGIELPICCANLSRARDLLIILMMTGELDFEQVEELTYLLEGHDLPEDIPILSRICEDLGIKLNFWNEL